MMQPGQLGQATRMQRTQSRQFMQSDFSQPSRARVVALPAYFREGDLVNHKKRGYGTVVMVDPEVQVKYDNDPRPVRYVDDDERPFSDEQLKERLLLMSAAPQSPLMKTLLSSMTSTEQRTKEFQAFRKIRHSEPAKYERDVASMLEMVDSVRDNPYAKVRFLFPLPSLRTKLGSLRRVLDLVVANCSDEVEHMRERALLIVLSQVCHAPGGIRALESKALSDPQTVANMAKLIKIWQGPL
eukprot:gnl/TRDRNA2_/TRDRNA2_169849_c0_seq3.p1 gnl/TRDRNA2_/TRDRNA2_169849_c0~~gnl/TRDRNA2_/TRDRNA2_169849_c0_seq3.p1  ORF type:complete len:278 (-),score=48.91 gnl/TRDRNA2_/TRDRNA2_169849_c0_seq3:32-754(-)